MNTRRTLGFVVFLAVALASANVAQLEPSQGRKIAPPSGLVPGTIDEPDCLVVLLASATAASSTQSPTTVGGPGPGGCTVTAACGPPIAGVPPNPLDYIVLTPPSIGGSFTGVVQCSKGQPFYYVLIYPGGVLNFPFGPCRTILVDITLPQVAACGPIPSGVAFAKPINNVNDCGLSFVSQAVCIGGGIPFSLTNAFECTIGF